MTFIAQRHLRGDSFTAEQWVDIPGPNGQPDFNSRDRCKEHAIEASQAGRHGVVVKVRILEVLEDIDVRTVQEAKP